MRIKRIVAVVAMALSVGIGGAVLSPASALACPWGPPGPCLCPPGVRC